MNGQRFYIAHVGYMAEKSQVIDELCARLGATVYTKAKYRARTLRQIFMGAFVARVAFQAGIGHPANLWVVVKEFRSRLRVLNLALHAQRQSLDPLDEQPGVEWRLART